MEWTVSPTTGEDERHQCGPIFFSPGSIKTDEILNATRERKALLYGVVSILAITPIPAFAFARVPFSTRELLYGLAIFCIAPTTLSSGVILTGQAGGNVVFALFLVVVTNLLGILTMPFFLQLAFSGVGSGAEIDAVALLVKLLLYILLPLVLGKCARHMFKLGGFVARWKLAMKFTSSFLLVMIPWMSVSTSRNKVMQLDGLSIVFLFFLGACLHLLYL